MNSYDVEQFVIHPVNWICPKFNLINEAFYDIVSNYLSHQCTNVPKMIQYRKSNSVNLCFSHMIRNKNNYRNEGLYYKLDVKY